jgi:hypothetical protein
MTQTTRLKFEATHEQGQVSALLKRPEDALALLLIAHGAGTDMEHYFLHGLAAALATQRIGSFRYNFPYREGGKRGGPNGKNILIATVRAAVAAASKAVPDLPLYAGGKSMGGRITSMAASEQPLPGVRGLLFFGFPLHPAGKPATERAEHLAAVELPMLFLQGPRDTLALPELIQPVVKKLGARASLHSVDGADHSFKVLKRSERTEADVIEELARVSATWIAERS